MQHLNSGQQIMNVILVVWRTLLVNSADDDVVGLLGR